jgi:hypothetical protein
MLWAMKLQFQQRFGPWAVVTGASSGIGAAFARGAAARGLNVVLVARREALLSDLAEELRSANGIQTRVLALDPSQAGSGASLLEATRDLDVGLLVASAGFGSSGSLLDAPLDEELAMVDVNCRAVLEHAHGFARRLVGRGRGALVLLSSVVAFQGAPWASNYAATKAYVQSLAEGLQRELVAHGVQVLACAPGPVHSGFAQRARMQLARAQSPRVVAEATLERLQRGGTIRPGALSLFLGLSLASLPRFVRIRVMERIMGGFAQAGGR